MKIYTKTGDNGKTSLLSGNRVKKHNARIETYGTVDELNSYVGWLRSKKLELKDVEFLIEIQNMLFVAGTSLALDEPTERIRMPEFRSEDIKVLENEIDVITAQLPPLSQFVLPGGHDAVGLCHVCRSVTRRAERQISALAEVANIDLMVLKYMNRLSDYFFVLSRKLSRHFGAEEVPWTPRKNQEKEQS